MLASGCHPKEVLAKIVAPENEFPCELSCPNREFSSITVLKLSNTQNGRHNSL